MALKLNIPSNRIGVGVAAPEAYAKINEYAFDGRNNTLRINVSIYYNEAARKSNARPVQSTQLQAKLSGPGALNLDTSNSGIRSEIYKWMKKQPFFTSSTDV